MKYRILVVLLSAVQIASSGFSDDIISLEWGGPWKGQESLFDEAAKKVVTPGVHTFVYDDTLSWRPKALVEGEGVEDFFLAISSSAGGSPAVPHILRLDSYQGRALALILIKGSQQNPPKMRGMFFLTKASTVASEAKAEWKFSAASSISFSGMIDGMVSEARWLVRDGQTWYVSEALLEPQQSYNKVEIRDLENPESIRWSEYHPEGAPLEKVSSSFTEHTFGDITGIGVYWDSYDSSTDVGGTSFCRLAVESLTLRTHK